MKKNKRIKIKGNCKQITYARNITYAGRNITKTYTFMGIWYWFYLIND